MSKVSQELKVLLYLNDHFERANPVTVKEVAKYFQVSDRQARRYLEDLLNDQAFGLDVSRGRYGGYRLTKRLNKDLLLPENLVLALSIAMRRNEHIEKVLSEIPNYIVTEHVAGDNRIDNEVLDRLETIMEAISKQKELSIRYDTDGLLRVVQPYKVAYTNHTYYLYAVHDDIIKKFDVRNMISIDILSSFKFKKDALDEIMSKLNRYGIKSNGKETVLRVRCQDLRALRNFDRYFEGRGIKDEEELTYEVVGASENELYYPLFRISTKSYEFLDEDFKNNYIKYLENQIRSIKNQ